MENSFGVCHFLINLFFFCKSELERERAKHFFQSEKYFPHISSPCCNPVVSCFHPAQRIKSYHKYHQESSTACYKYFISLLVIIVMWQWDMINRVVITMMHSGWTQDTVSYGTVVTRLNTWYNQYWPTQCGHRTKWWPFILSWATTSWTDAIFQIKGLPHSGHNQASVQTTETTWIFNKA